MTPDKRIEISIASNTDRENIYHLRHDVFSSELMQHSENELNILLKVKQDSKIKLQVFDISGNVKAFQEQNINKGGY